MIVGKNKSVSIISNITVKGCARPFHVDAVITMEGQKYPLIAHFNKTAEMIDFKFDGKPPTGTETKLPEVRNGYIPATGGHLMVLLERLDDMDHGVLEHRTDDEEDMPHLAFLFVSVLYMSSTVKACIKYLLNFCNRLKFVSTYLYNGSCLRDSQLAGVRLELLNLQFLAHRFLFYWKKPALSPVQFFIAES